MCLEYSVTISETMADEISAIDDSKEITAAIAEICMRQKQYILASKKYVQMGDRVKALKALMSTGDKDKVIFFASNTPSSFCISYLSRCQWLEAARYMHHDGKLPSIAKLEGRSPAP